MVLGHSRGIFDIYWIYFCFIIISYLFRGSALQVRWYNTSFFLFFFALSLSVHFLVCNTVYVAWG